MRSKRKPSLLLYIAFILASCGTAVSPTVTERPDPMTLAGGNIHPPGEGFNGWPCWDGSIVLVKDKCPPKPEFKNADPFFDKVKCWDNSMVFHTSQCPRQPQCYDGTLVTSVDQCPQRPPMPIIDPQCWDGTMVFHRDQCPIICPDGNKSTSEPPDYKAKCPTHSSGLDN